MGRAWCEHCGKYVYPEGSIYSENMTDEIRGVSFEFEAKFYRCPVCNDLVLDSWLCDENTHRAHLAYVKAREGRV